MFATITSIYGKPVKVVINGGAVSIDNKRLAHESYLRRAILDKAHELSDLLEYNQPDSDDFAKD